MEEIIVKAIDRKTSGVVVVKYIVKGIIAMPVAEATLNTKWQSQEVDYLEKDVGVGGEVKVMIEQKGQYTNITKVDMESAVKNELGAPVEKVLDAPQKQSLLSQKDIQIISQCMMKCMFYAKAPKDAAEVFDAFKTFTARLENE